MHVKCQRCGTDFQLDDSFIGSDKTRVRCTVCGKRFDVRVESVAVESMLPPRKPAPVESRYQNSGKPPRSKNDHDRFDAEVDAALGTLDVDPFSPNTKKVMPIQVVNSNAPGDSDPAPKVRRTRSKPLFPVEYVVAVGILGLVAVGVWFAWDDRPVPIKTTTPDAVVTPEAPKPPAPPPPISSLLPGISLEQADRLLRQDQLGTYADAAKVFEHAYVMRADMSIYLRLSRTYARWAQALRFHVTDREMTKTGEASGASAKSVGDLSASEIEDIERQHKDLMYKAYENAKRALGEVRAGFNPKVEFALADAERLLKNYDAAKSHLHRAQALVDHLDSDDWYIATLVEAKGSPAGLCYYENQLREASEDPSSAIGVSLLLARCYQQSGRKGLARAEVEGVRARYPGHTEALALLRAWTVTGQSVEPTNDENATEDPFDDALKNADALKVKVEPAPRDEIEITQIPTPADDVMAAYAVQVKKGFAKLYHRKTFDEAKSHFNKAIEVWAQGGAAYAGLGYVARADDQLPTAAEYFKTAGKLNYTLAWFELGNTLVELARYPDARKAYERYLRLDAQGRFVNKAKNMLVKIKHLKAGDPPPTIVRFRKADDKTAEPAADKAASTKTKTTEKAAKPTAGAAPAAAKVDDKTSKAPASAPAAAKVDDKTSKAPASAPAAASSEATPPTAVKSAAPAAAPVSTAPPAPTAPSSKPAP